jgi:hypothetical protein
VSLFPCTQPDSVSHVWCVWSQDELDRSMIHCQSLSRISRDARGVPSFDHFRSDPPFEKDILQDILLPDPKPSLSSLSRSTGRTAGRCQGLMGSKIAILLFFVLCETPKAPLVFPPKTCLLAYVSEGVGRTQQCPNMGRY